MKCTLILAICSYLCASSAFAGFNLGNSARSGNAGSLTVSMVTLADGTVVTVAPTR